MEKFENANGAVHMYAAPAANGLLAVTFDKQEAIDSDLTFNEYRVPTPGECGSVTIFEHAEHTGEVY